MKWLLYFLSGVVICALIKASLGYIGFWVGVSVLLLAWLSNFFTSGCVNNKILLKNSLRVDVVFVSAVAVGLGFVWASLDIRSMDHPSHFDAWYAKPFWVKGTVVGLPKLKEADFHFSFETECWIPLLSGQESPLQYRFDRLKRKLCRPPASLRRLQVSLYEWQGRSIKPGMTAWLPLKVKPPRGTVNPGTWDYERWLYVYRVGGRAVLADSDLMPLWLAEKFALDRFRYKISDKIRNIVGSTEVSSSLFPALLVGDRRYFTAEQWQVFNTLGIGHLIAISGLHIGLFSLFGMGLVRLVVRSRAYLLHYWPLQHWQLLGALVFGTVYSLMAGLSLPTVRALLALATICIWQWTRSVFSAFQTLVVVVCLVLVFCPRAVFDVSFWLSFGAVALIIWLLSQKTLFPAWLNAVRIQAFLCVGLVPMNLMFFQQVTWLAPLVNLVLVPLVGWVLIPLLFLSLLLALISEKLFGLLLGALAFAVDWVWEGLQWLGNNAWVSTPIFIQQPIIWIGVISAIGLWLLPFGWPKKWLSLVFLAVVLLLKEHKLAPGEFSLAVLDVGQGLSIAIQTRDHVLVYDTGPAYDQSSSADRVIVPFLKYYHRSKIDMLVLSHLDHDHAGSAVSLANLFPIEHEIGLAPLGLGKTQSICVRGKVWQWDEVRFEVLYPMEVFAENEITRNVSCVLRVSGAYHSVLLTGDIDRDMEQTLLKTDSTLEADVLLVPHHGSVSSSSTGLLYRVNPNLALVSYGWRNAFGHPHPEVLRRYQVRRIPVLSTANSGAITLLSTSSSGELPQLEEARKDDRPIWRY